MALFLSVKIILVVAYAKITGLPVWRKYINRSMLFLRPQSVFKRAVERNCDIRASISTRHLRTVRQYFTIQISTIHSREPSALLGWRYRTLNSNQITVNLMFCEVLLPVHLYIIAIFQSVHNLRKVPRIKGMAICLVWGKIKPHIRCLAEQQTKVICICARRPATYMPQLLHRATLLLI